MKVSGTVQEVVFLLLTGAVFCTRRHGTGAVLTGAFPTVKRFLSPPPPKKGSGKFYCYYCRERHVGASFENCHDDFPYTAALSRDMNAA